MDIESTMPRGIKDRLREDEAVRGHDKRVGPRGAYARACLGIQRLRLQHFQVVLEREALGCAHYGLHAAPGGPVRLCQDKGDLMARLQEASKRSLGKFGSARED